MLTEKEIVKHFRLQNEEEEVETSLDDPDDAQLTEDGDEDNQDDDLSQEWDKES